MQPTEKESDGASEGLAWKIGVGVLGAVVGWLVSLTTDKFSALALAIAGVVVFETTLHLVKAWMQRHSAKRRDVYTNLSKRIFAEGRAKKAENVQPAVNAAANARDALESCVYVRVRITPHINIHTMPRPIHWIGPGSEEEDDRPFLTGQQDITLENVEVVNLKPSASAVLEFHLHYSVGGKSGAFQFSEFKIDDGEWKERLVLPLGSAPLSVSMRKEFPVIDGEDLPRRFEFDKARLEVRDLQNRSRAPMTFKIPGQSQELSG